MAFSKPSQSANMKPTPSTTRCSKNGSRFIVSSFIFIAFLCIIASVNEIRFDSLSHLTRCISTSTTLHIDNNDSDSESGDGDNLRVLIGILTLPGQYHRRNFLRQVYGVQTAPFGARVDVKFVFCNLTTDEQEFLVALEILRYDDIIILNCTENMNRGKSFTYFSSLPSMLKNATTTTGNGELRQHHPPYHYVMKADDDTFIRVDSLVRSLMPLSRQDLYYGYVIPCESMDAYRHYMSGMGYLVSWDLVEWFGKQSDIITPAELIGPEDKILGDMIRGGKKGKNRFNAKWGMYNYPDPPNKCSHELWPETVAVHLLKTPEKWIKTLRYFNFTMDLKPSKLYHFDSIRS